MKTIWLARLSSGWEKAPDKRSKMLEEAGLYIEVPLEKWENFLQAKKELEKSVINKATAEIVNYTTQDR